MTQAELFNLAAMKGLDMDEAIDAVLAGIKAPFAELCFNAWIKADEEMEAYRREKLKGILEREIAKGEQA